MQNVNKRQMIEFGRNEMNAKGTNFRLNEIKIKTKIIMTQRSRHTKKKSTTTENAHNTVTIG